MFCWGKERLDSSNEYFTQRRGEIPPNHCHPEESRLVRDDEGPEGP